METILLALDLFGTFAFAISGAFKGIKYELDFLGVLVLSTMTGIGGGVMRDMLCGDFPPVILKNEIYVLVCVAGGIMVFFSAPQIAKRWDIVLFADAIGLGVFAGIGGLKGVDHNFGLIGIILLGTLTATGGGVIRDMLVSEIPIVIRTDFYATAVIIGCMVLAVLNFLSAPRYVVLLSCIAVTIVCRLLAIKFKMSLPRVKSLPESPSKLTRTYRERKRLR
jgi:uncharacterized membrane protein YeiH